MNGSVRPPLTGPLSFANIWENSKLKAWRANLTKFKDLKLFMCKILFLIFALLT